MTSPNHQPAPPISDDRNDAIEQLWRIYAAINEWIRFADTKAAALLALNGVLVAAAVSPLKEEWNFLTNHPTVLVLLTLCGVSLFVSAFYCLKCIQPKLRIKPAPASSTSLIFFEDIAVYESAELYGNAALALSKQEGAFNEISKQVWAVSQVAHAKHRQIHWAVLSLIFGLLCCFGAAAAGYAF